MSAALMPDALAALLLPISPQAPCGVPKPGDGIFQKIAEAAREDDANLPQGIWEQPHKRADWSQVEQLCADTLANSVKDLRIVAWLAEAWLRQRGLEGLVDGARLLQASLEQYWDGLYPLPEDGDLDARLAALEWFDRHMAQALGGVQIAAGASPAGRLFTLAEWALVLRHERQGAQAAGARRGAAPAPGDGKELTRQHFNTAVAMTPAHFYQVLQQQLLATVAALEALAQALAARLDEQAPRLAAIEARLAECYQALQELAGLSWEAAPEGDEDDAAWIDEDGAHGMERRLAHEADRRQARGRANAGAPRSRDEAYQRLEEAADYLLRTEPHSPVPYLVKRAVGWGSMPLAELLQELMDNESDLKQIYRLLGTHGR